jgi:hypothetical protein
MVHIARFALLGAKVSLCDESDHFAREAKGSREARHY